MTAARNSSIKADAPAVAAREDEFPVGASLPPQGMERREFLRVMGASLAMSAAAGCTKQPKEEIVPYVRQPEELVLGTAQYYATAMDIGGHAQGLLVCSHEGRPTKIEGNPAHPMTQGRSSVLMQAALLDLYDPDRSKSVRHLGMAGTWEDFLGELLQQSTHWNSDGGQGVRLLVDGRSSPTLRVQLETLQNRFPKLKWHRYDPAFPEPVMPAVCDFSKAEVVLSLDDDFLGASDAVLKDVQDFTRHRSDAKGMNRLYVIEPVPSITGAMADHRMAAKPSRVEAIAGQLLEALRREADPSDPWLAAMLRDLKLHRGKSAILAGRYLAKAVHEAVREMNDRLGNTGQTVFPGTAVAPTPGIDALVGAMQAGEVTALFLVGVNPVFTAPAEFKFAEALRKVAFTVHLGLQADETAELCRWHVPESHFLEAWSDARAVDGTLSVVQPLIEPLYPSKSAHELLAALLEQVPGSGYDIVRAAWRKRHVGADFEPWWRRVLHDGVWKNEEVPPASASNTAQLANPESAAGLELMIRPDPYLLDGRHANNAWLQELPKPISRLTWGNAVFIGPKTSAALHVQEGDVVELKRAQVSATAPVFVLPGQAEDCALVHLGGGRSRAGRVGNGVGFNAAFLQTWAEPWGGGGWEIRKTGGRYIFATMHGHSRMEGRDFVRVETVNGAAREVTEPTMLFHLKPMEPEPPPTAEESLYAKVSYQRPAWGMAIDLSRCIGCNACTLACQAENNIPVVGSEQVKKGREMHWIRVDQYVEGSMESPEILHQPVPCMHCENAPCELVCPVGATVHDHQGLNLMVYNRCVGTRYCSNNCPYKVRRFNFLKYNDEHAPQLKMMRNPDVTVRMRGVMEKCTYCVQRIAVARITADKENRDIRDGEVVPACAQTCPADAIVFGDILDQGSRVKGQRESPRRYSLLGELNTRPRTTYLSKLRNPNPEMPA
jgi:molybdopterin-containing oxidoreductase family iron-sulfur binding subunit